MNRPTAIVPASPTAPAGQRCVVCGAPPGKGRRICDICHRCPNCDIPPRQRCVVCHGPAVLVIDEVQQLPCSHHALLTPEGVVDGWVDTGAMTLNLARAAGCTDRMATRFEEHATGIQRWRAETAERIAAANRG